jgi:hypothetical protein
MEDIHRHLEKAAEKLKPPRVRNACRNAFNHLRKAWTLHPVDSEMSLFRAVTAEEEAATAVIRALNAQGYPNAGLLKERLHPHKAAIWPFIQAVNEKMAEKDIPTPNIRLSIEGEPRIDFSIDLAAQAGLEKPLWSTPDEPLNWSFWSDRTGPFRLHDFSEELAMLASRKGANDIEAYVKREANLRNQLLYASHEGIPSVEFPDGTLLDRRMRVTVMVSLTVAIMQTKMHQQFVVQCLDALLRAVQRFDGELPAFPPVDPRRERIELVEQLDGSRKLSLVRPVANYSFRLAYMPTPSSYTTIDRPSSSSVDKGDGSND